MSLKIKNDTFLSRMMFGLNLQNFAFIAELPLKRQFFTDMFGLRRSLFCVGIGDLCVVCARLDDHVCVNGD